MKLWLATLSVALGALASVAHADRELTIELVVGDDDPPSHLCVVAEEIATPDHVLFGDADRLTLESSADDHTKLIPRKVVESLPQAIVCVHPPSGTWHGPAEDACAPSFAPQPDEALLCTSNRAPGRTDRLQVVVLRLIEVRLLTVRLVGNVATLAVRDLGHTAEAGLKIDAIGGHYGHSSAVSVPRSSTREEAILYLHRKCLPRRIDTISRPCSDDEIIRLSAGQWRSYVRLPTPLDLQVPFLTSDQRITAEICGIRHVAVSSQTPRREPLTLLPTTLRFRWKRHCLVPDGPCPEITLPQVAGSPTVHSASSGGDWCDYEVSSEPRDTPIAFPTEVRFDLVRNTIDCEMHETWTDTLRYVGEELTSYVPADQRWAAIHWPNGIDARAKEMRDRIRGVVLSGPTGVTTQVPIGTPRINVPGLQCNDQFTFRYVGDRTYDERTLHVVPYTGRLDLATSGPDDLSARRLTLALTVGGGGGLRSPSDGMASPYALSLEAIGVFKPPILKRTLIELRLGVLYAKQPFRSISLIRDGGSDETEAKDSLPFLHVSLEPGFTWALSDDIYFGFAAGAALGTNLFLEDGDKATTTPELVLQPLLVAWRISSAFALEASVRVFLFGYWVRVRQDETGIISHEDVPTTLTALTLALRYDDII